MNFLLSTIALLAGPVIYALGRRHTVTEHLLDVIVIATIAWIIGVHIVPEVFSTGGPIAILFIAAGILFPLALRHVFHLASHTAHVALLTLAAAALTLHAIIDGIALLTGERLALAVILHRLPVGMAIWWTFRPALGQTAAIVAFALLISATAATFFLGGPIVEIAESRTLALFQAFVSGSLIDLVFAGLREKLSRWSR